MNEDYINEKLNEIFFPIGIRRIKEFKENHYRLAYYTTEETAKKILQNREFWMRNACVMNDYSEIQYGINKVIMMLDIFKPENKLTQPLATIYARAKEKFFYSDKRECISWKFNTYLTSFTEHKRTENDDGRLSMWRAYGGGNGVAIVFKEDYLFDNLKNKDYFTKEIFLSPVEYVNEKEMIGKIREVLCSITNNNNQQFLIDLTQNPKYGEDMIYHIFRNMLGAAVVSLKHPGFKEEIEWRAVAHGHDLENEKNRENFEIENVKGVEQFVYKIRFIPDDLFNAIDYVIIGPNADMGIRNVTAKVFIRIMMDSFKKSREEVEKKIRLSSIPYRPM